MSNFGTLTDYTTGTPIRPATATEWRKTAGRLADPGDGYTGAFQDDGRSVYVDGGPEAAVTDTDIRALRDEAATAGDTGMADLCTRALGEDCDQEPGNADAAAAARCAEVILDTRMRAAED